MSMRLLLVLTVVLAAVGGRLEASAEVSSRGLFMDRLMSMNGCGRFAGLVNATANATEPFQYTLANGGLVVFCPDDKAVAAFERSFHHDLGADAQLAVLLYHGVAPASLRERKWMLTVPTLATDLANGGYGLTIRHRGDKMELSSSSGRVARVIRTVTDEEDRDRLVVYLIDAVLLPRLPMDYCSDSSCPRYGEVKHRALTATLIIVAALGAAVVVFMAVLMLGAIICASLTTRPRHPSP